MTVSRYYGSALSLTLDGASRNADLAPGLIHNGWGTCLIKGNTITGNTAARYPGLYLETRKDHRDSDKRNDKVGFVATGNTIANNVASSDSAAVRIENEGHFSANTIIDNAGGSQQTSAAVKVFSCAGTGPDILHANNNT